MMPQQQIEEFLAKARDADASATAATDPSSKEDWTRVAAGYRNLAHSVRTTIVMDELSDRPLR